MFAAELYRKIKRTAVSHTLIKFVKIGIGQAHAAGMQAQSPIFTRSESFLSVVVMFDESGRLAHFHDDDGDQREADADEVTVPRQIGHAERRDDAGRKQHERDEHRRDGGDDPKVLVGERADLKQRPLGTHVVRVHHLRERQVQESQRAAARFPRQLFADKVRA